MASRRKGRTLAVQALYAWDTRRSGKKDTTLPDGLLDFGWLDDPQSVDESTLAFARLLVAGTIENAPAIDALIKAQLKHWELSRLNRVDLAILRMSVYALMFQPDIDPPIIITEAIALSESFGTDDSYRFINGVLDGIRLALETAR